MSSLSVPTINLLGMHGGRPIPTTFNIRSGHTSNSSLWLQMANRLAVQNEEQGITWERELFGEIRQLKTLGVQQRLGWWVPFVAHMPILALESGQTDRQTADYCNPRVHALSIKFSLPYIAYVINFTRLPLSLSLSLSLFLFSACNMKNWESLRMRLTKQHCHKSFASCFLLVLVAPRNKQNYTQTMWIRPH